MSKILEAKAIADSFVHCGDYGQFYYDLKEKVVHLVGGDADFDEEDGLTGYDEIKEKFDEIDVKLEIECEYIPEGIKEEPERFVLFSRGIEFNETRLLTAEETILLYNAIRKER